MTNARSAAQRRRAEEDAEEDRIEEEARQQRLAEEEAARQAEEARLKVLFILLGHHVCAISHLTVACLYCELPKGNGSSTVPDLLLNTVTVDVPVSLIFSHVFTRLHLLNPSHHQASCPELNDTAPICHCLQQQMMLYKDNLKQTAR